MVKEVSYREFHKQRDEDPEPPEISDQAYEAGSFIKCLLCWAQGANPPWGSGILYDQLVIGCKTLGYSCQEGYCAALEYPAGTMYQGGQRLELFRIQGLKWRADNRVTV